MQCVANKIFLELYLPMSFYNSKKNLLILHFLHLSDNFQLIWYTPLVQGLLIGSYTDERNDLYTENTIWHRSVRLHWIGQRDYILTSGFLTTNTLHILTWHTPGVDCPLEMTSVMEMKYHHLHEPFLPAAIPVGLQKTMRRGMYHILTLRHWNGILTKVITLKMVAVCSCTTNLTVLCKNQAMTITRKIF